MVKTKPAIQTIKHQFQSQFARRLNLLHPACLERERERWYREFVMISSWWVGLMVAGRSQQTCHTVMLMLDNVPSGAGWFLNPGSCDRIICRNVGISNHSSASCRHISQPSTGGEHAPLSLVSGGLVSPLYNTNIYIHHTAFSWPQQPGQPFKCVLYWCSAVRTSELDPNQKSIHVYSEN